VSPTLISLSLEFSLVCKDVVSYRVTQLEPALELEPVGFATSLSRCQLSNFVQKLTNVTGAKCGSTYIDANFKRWLRNLISDRNYRQLDPKSSRKINAHTTEGQKIRAIMKEFDGYKRKFASGSRDMKIDLPEPLENLDIKGKVDKGLLTITSYV
jgi:hypothetical protein